jgi:hypothetical protein
MLDKAINLPQIPDSDLDGGPELIENQDVKDRKATSKDYMVGAHVKSLENTANRESEYLIMQINSAGV